MMLLSYALCKDLQPKQMDIKTKYLNANINEEIFMQQPESFENYNGQRFPLACKLKKNLYAFTQSGKNCYLTIKGFLGDLVLFHLFKVNASLLKGRRRYRGEDLSLGRWYG